MRPLRRPLRLTASVSALLLAGCMSVGTPPPTFDEAAWRTLLDDGRYRTALQQLSTHELATDQRDALQTEVEQRARAQRRKLIQEANRLAEAGHLRRADQLLAHASKEQLDIAELVSARTRLERQISVREMRALARVYLLKGNQLLAEAELLTRLETITSSPDAARLSRENLSNRKQVAMRLQQTGEAALKRGEYGDAVAALQLAHRLDSEADVSRLLAEARRGHAVVAGQEREAVAKARQKIHDDLRAEIEASLAAGNYSQAQELLKRLEELGINPDAVKAVQSAVGQAVAEFTERSTVEGDRRYAEGAIERALQHWEAAYAIAPSEALAGRITKAQRFLETYRELKQPPLPPG